MPKQYGTEGPRTLWPSVSASQSLGACEGLAQLLFDRLISRADDQGRLVDDAEIIRATCMTNVREATARKVSRWLEELASPGEQDPMILRYQIGPRKLIQLLNWWDSQSGMRRAYPSRWEAPPGWKDRIYGHSEAAQKELEEEGRKRAESAGSMRAQRGQSAGSAPAERGQSAGSAPLPRSARGAHTEPNRTEPIHLVETSSTTTPPPTAGTDDQAEPDAHPTNGAATSERPVSTVAQVQQRVEHVLGWFTNQHGWATIAAARYADEKDAALTLARLPVETEILSSALQLAWNATDPDDRPSSLRYLIEDVTDRVRDHLRSQPSSLLRGSTWAKLDLKSVLA